MSRGKNGSFGGCAFNFGNKIQSAIIQAANWDQIEAFKFFIGAVMQDQPLKIDPILLKEARRSGLNAMVRMLILGGVHLASSLHRRASKALPAIYYRFT